MLAFIIFHIPIMVQTSLSVAAAILTILDVTVTFYTCWNGFKVYLVPTFNQILVTSVINWLYGQVNCSLEQRLASIRPSKRSQTPNLHAICDLVHFRRHHARLTGLVHATNDFYWSNGVLYFFLTNIPINVYMTTFLFYKRMTAVENLILYFIFVIQVCGLFLSVAIPARTYTFAHSCKRYLVAVQSLLGGQFMSLKLKYLSMYEQTNCNTKKITYSIGPATEITQRILFEVRQSPGELVFEART